MFSLGAWLKAFVLIFCLFPLATPLVLAKTEVVEWNSPAAALEIACKEFGVCEWEGATPSQGRFLSLLPEMQKGLSKFHPGEIETIVAQEAEPINLKLKERGHPIVLRPWPKGMGFGFAAFVDATFEWPAEGNPVIFRVPRVGGEWKGFSLNVKQNHVAFHHFHPGWEPIVVVPTKLDDTIVLFWRSPEKPKEGTTESMFLLYDVAKMLADAVRTNGVVDSHASDSYTEVLLPVLDVSQEVDVSWLEGLHAVGTRGTRIMEAKQHVHFRVDERGGKVKTTTAMSMGRGANSIYQFDGPFYMVVLRGDKTFIIAAHVDTDSFISTDDAPNPLEGSQKESRIVPAHPSLSDADTANISPREMVDDLERGAIESPGQYWVLPTGSEPEDALSRLMRLMLAANLTFKDAGINPTRVQAAMQESFWRRVTYWTYRESLFNPELPFQSDDLYHARVQKCRALQAHGEWIQSALSSANKSTTPEEDLRRHVAVLEAIFEKPRSFFPEAPVARIMQEIHGCVSQ